MLHESWPLLAYHFKLYPDDVPRFSAAEWTTYIVALNKIVEESQQS